MPPELGLCLTPISSNNTSSEHIFMVPKLLEPLKFYCSSGILFDRWADRSSAVGTDGKERKFDHPFLQVRVSKFYEDSISPAQYKP